MTKKITTAARCTLLLFLCCSFFAAVAQAHKPDGPLPTTFTFTPSKDYTLAGKVKEESPGVKSYNEIFMMDIVWFEKTAVFVQKIKLHGPQVTVQGKVEFIVCTEEMCLPGAAVPFSRNVR